MNETEVTDRFDAIVPPSAVRVAKHTATKLPLCQRASIRDVWLRSC